MITDSITIKKLIQHEKRLVKFYYRSFLSILTIALAVVGINVFAGKLGEIGSVLSSVFLGVLSYFPFHQVSKRKDHITALETLQENLKSGRHDPRELGDMVKTRLQKMLED